MPDEKSFHQLLIQNLRINPDKFLRYYGAKPSELQFEIAVKAVSELIEDFGLTELKLEEMPNYALFLRRDIFAQVLLCLTFADFYLESTSGNNRGKLSQEIVSNRQAMANNILTYLRTQMGSQIDDNKVFQWAIDKQAPPSVRSKRHPSVRPCRDSDHPLKSTTVQPARSNSSTPPAS